MTAVDAVAAEGAAPLPLGGSPIWEDPDPMGDGAAGAVGGEGSRWYPSAWKRCWRFSTTWWSVSSERGRSWQPLKISHKRTPKDHASLLLLQRR